MSATSDSSAHSTSSRRVVTFVTGNKNKLRETQACFGDSVTLQAQAVDLPELQGDPLDIARSKVELASERVSGPVMTEDTSLCFNALNGLPGPYVKWFLDKTGHEGLNNLLAAYEDKSAYAQCIFAYCEGRGKEVQLFVGRCPGKIVPSRGPKDFGWDAVFQPDGYEQTFAELDKSVKNQISHRARAIQKVQQYFKQQDKQNATN